MHSDATLGRRAVGPAGSPAGAAAWPPAGTAWTPDGAWTVDVPFGSPGVARTSDAALAAGFPVPAPRASAPAESGAAGSGAAGSGAAEPSWALPMAWLAGHLPLTLIMDLSMPFGPRSRELLVEEPPR